MPHLRLILTLLVSSLLLSTTAKAQQFFLQVDDVYAPVQSALQQQDADQAQRHLDTLAASHAESGDFHYLQGLIRMLDLQESSRLRMPFIARRMRKDFEEALKYEPDHELAHFGLFQWHQFAPGIAGGDKDVMQHHLDQLISADSPLQFPARLSLLPSEDAFEQEETLYHAWFEAASDNYTARYDYAVRRINTGHFETALTQLKHSLQGIGDSEDEAELRSALQYQYGKLAAESGTELDKGESLLRELINAETLPDSISRPWAEFRLAQIEAHRGDLTLVEAFIETLDNHDDERLQNAALAFREERLEQCCS